MYNWSMPKICVKYRKYWKKTMRVWADRAILGSQKLFSKLTSIFPRKTHDNFQIDIQKITQIRKSWAPSFSNQKRNVGSSQWLKNSWIWVIKHILIINEKTLFNILDTFHSKSRKENWNVYLYIMCCHLTGLWTS